jgi:predicted DNA-binding transcriptional regulator YafY
VRADRLVSLVLLLQARGQMTAVTLAGELGVSVRTVYRDLAALGAAGVPLLTESGPGGGCALLEGYRFPLRGLRPEEAEALLILGVPGVISELGLDDAAAAAQRQIRVTSGRGDGGPRTLVHIDTPRWFRGQEEVPHLRTLAAALRRRRCLSIRYHRPDTPPAPAARGASPPAPSAPAARGTDPAPVRGAALPPVRVVGPLGLVNKAGIWYLVATGRHGRVTVFRAARIGSARILDQESDIPAEFDLAGFWERWSAEFTGSRSRLPVKLRASPHALALFGEIFGADAGPALDAALPPDEQGWQVVTLSFEHEHAAAHRLAGFGGQVEVLSPASVRERLVAAAHGILGRYGS